MRVPLSRYSFGDMLVIGGMLLAAAVLAWLYVGVWLAAVFVGLLIFLLFFFRDPYREVPGEEGLLVSPADGTVVDIEQVSDCGLIDGRAWKIGIFMSVFNAHVNRAPTAGTVTKIQYDPGKFFNALRAVSASANESNCVFMKCPQVPGEQVVIKQISGVLARRIVCGCKVGQTLACGEKFGMIKFGSRVELYVSYSEGLQVQVSKGQKVKAGSSVLLRFEPSASEAE